MTTPQILREWVEALRSGEFEQGRSVLRLEKLDDSVPGKVVPTYCCLGVLCEVMVRHGLAIRDDNAYQATGAAAAPAMDVRFESSLLPNGIWQYLNLGQSDPYIDSQGRTLASINDDGDADFDDIADLIEGQWLR